jgi:hypothetical protein
MITRIIILTALALYLAALGCVVVDRDDTAGPRPVGVSMADTLHPSKTPAPNIPPGPLHVVAGLPYRGVVLQIQRVDWMDKYKQGIDQIAAVGADSVEMVIDTRQENGTSSHIYLDMRMTPTPDALGDLIRYAKGKGLRVILMPIVLLDAPQGNQWRGTIAPESWPDWWESYRSMLQHFAYIAQGNGVDLFVVGSELITTESNIEEWTKTIAMVRGIFKGNLTYSGNWDRYEAVSFWDQLDLIGMNSYWTLGPDRHVTLRQIENRWKEIQDGLLPFMVKTRKPLILLEVGWCSLANAADEPWDYTRDELDIDLDLQNRLYQGFFNSWYGNPKLGGFMIWNWMPNWGSPKDEGYTKGYTPWGKPAEQIMRQWLAKPKWVVQ